MVQKMHKLIDRKRPATIPAESTDSEYQVRVISATEAEGPARSVVITCGEK